jgi:hypothetical protein
MKALLVLLMNAALVLTSCGQEPTSKREQEARERDSKLVQEQDELVLIPAASDLPANFASLPKAEQEKVLVDLANTLEVQTEFSLGAGCGTYRCYAVGSERAGYIGPRGAAVAGPAGAAGISFISGNYCYKGKTSSAVCGNVWK